MEENTMGAMHFDGEKGAERLHALMRSIANVRGLDQEGTQEYLLGWVYGLADAGALSEDDISAAQQFIGKRKFEKPNEELIDLYEYPSARYRRVEGKSICDLEDEIMTGGPYEDSRICTIYRIANDENHDLHYVAKHYVFLSRARGASYRPD